MLKRIREIYSRSKFSRNTAPKLLSLLFAIVFWVFVMDQVNPEITRSLQDVPVQLMGIEELKARNYEIMGEREFNVDVTLKGRRNEVNSITKQEVEISADIGDLTSGNQTILLNQNVSIEDITIDSISKDNITLDIDEIIRQPIDVKIIKQGTVPEGYLTEDMTLSLQQVFIKGPESFVNSVESVRGIINITNETTRISKEVAVEPIDINGETVTGLEVETNYVSVTIPVSKLMDVTIQPSTVGTVKEGFGLTAIKVTPDSVNVRGQREVINALKFIETMDVNLNGASESFEIYTKLNVPEDVTMNQYLDEVKVDVTIEEIITTEFTYDYSDITFLNKASSLRTNMADLEGVVLLRVSAFESIANSLTKNDLTLYVDAEDFEAGTINAEIVLNKHNEFNGIEIIPSNIELEIVDLDAEPVEEETTEEDTE
ncbi:hypothetical protein EZV73_20580 [Acidaminobacter sp. JC074]|uniref:CdaR family protein n=1 Tax=Acidaminobacter sp. JC074 TaxID=2530199 RepID=UPI001F1118E7|nr:CdaR family protein [Acidaminobacter sp. JC074]MCH4889987.1 hypothetical protein [Acidaminobacter sp. JC074]